MPNENRPGADSHVQRGRSYSTLSATRSGVDPRTVASKLIVDRRHGSGGVNGDFDVSAMGLTSLTYLQEISDKVASNSEDADNLFQLLPEIELAMQILVAMVLAPKDFVSTNLTYTFPPNLLPPDMVTELLKAHETHSKTSYNIKPKLPEILRKALFVDGSWPVAVLPENVLDDVINGRNVQVVEAFKKQENGYKVGVHRGYLGMPNERSKSGGMSIESVLSDVIKEPATYSPSIRLFEKDKGAFLAPEIYDDPHLLKLPRILESLKRDRKKTATESTKPYTSSAGGERLNGDVSRYYKEPPTEYAPFLQMPTTDQATRETVGYGLILELPPESIIPCFRPGSPKNRNGGFVILDEFGYPISRASQTDYYRNLTQNVSGQSGEKLTGLLKSISQTETEQDAISKTMNSQQQFLTFARVMERELQQRLDAGSIGHLTVGKQMMAYEIMLARGFSNMQTRIVYLPEDLLVYWAYEFNDDGTGRSLLENGKILTAMRAMNMFSNMNGQIRNNIDHKTLKVTTDPNDPNPAKTKQAMMYQYALHRLNSMPWATSNPRRMVEYMQNAGINVEMEGGADYPETRLEVIDNDITMSEVDLTFDEDLRKRQLMSYGVSPELADLTTTIEFSSKMITSNALSVKRAIAIQDTTIRFIKEFEVKKTLAAKPAVDEYLKIIGKYSDKLTAEQKQAGEHAILDIFLMNYEPKLPRPSAGLRQQMEDLDEFEQAVDKMLDAAFDEDAYKAEVVGQANNELVGFIKAQAKSKLMLDWCRTENFLPEVTKMFDINGQDAPGTVFFKEAIAHAKKSNHIIKAVGTQLTALGVISDNQWAKIKEELDKVRTEQSEQTDYGSESSVGIEEGGENDDDFSFDLPGNDQEEEEQEEEEDEDTPPKDDLPAEQEEEEEEDAPASDSAPKDE